MKKLSILFELSSTEFRSKIKKLGYTEKGNELTSGGDLKSNFLNILGKFLDDWKKLNPKCPITFTSGNDAHHKRITSYVSRHTKGEAVDVVLPKSCHSSFISLLNSYKLKYNGFSFIDEYTNPTDKSTGGHFHISYREGVPEGSSPSNVGISSTETTSTDTSVVTPTTSDKPDDEYDTITKKMVSSFVVPIADKIVNPLQNEHISSKEKRIIRDIEKIKKLL
jgi:hypothetical protein